MPQPRTINITQDGFFKNGGAVTHSPDNGIEIHVDPGDTLDIVYENSPTRQLGVIFIPLQPSPFAEEPSSTELPLTWWYSQTKLTVSTDAVVKGKTFVIRPPGNKGGQGKSGTLVVSG